MEGDLRAGGAADPVLLLGLDPLDEVQIVNIVHQALGVLGDGQHPLAFLLAHNLAAAALAHALHHFLVGQDAFTAGAPVHGHGSLVGQALLEHLQEDPLGPLVVLGVGCIHHPIPVEAVAQHFELTGEVLDVLSGDDGGVDMVLDGKVLRGQAEGVIADGEQDVVALHALFPRHNIHRGKGPGMSHMQACGTGVRKLNEPVELGLIAAGDGGVGLRLFPAILPFFLNGGKIVLHTDYPLLIILPPAAGAAAAWRGRSPQNRSRDAPDCRTCGPHP